MRRQLVALQRGVGQESEQDTGLANLEENVAARLRAHDPQAQDRLVEGSRRLEVIDVDGGFDNGLSSPVRPPSIQFHQHVIPLDLDGKALDSFTGWRCQHFSGFDVELSTVPGAGDDLSCQVALPNGPPTWVQVLSRA